MEQGTPLCMVSQSNSVISSSMSVLLIHLGEIQSQHECPGKIQRADDNAMENKETPSTFKARGC